MLQPAVRVSRSSELDDLKSSGDKVLAEALRLVGDLQRTQHELAGALKAERVNRTLAGQNSKAYPQ